MWRERVGVVEQAENVVVVVVVASWIGLGEPKWEIRRVLVVYEIGHVGCPECSSQSGPACWRDVERSKTRSKMLCKKASTTSTMNSVTSKEI